MAGQTKSSDTQGSKQVTSVSISGIGGFKNASPSAGDLAETERSLAYQNPPKWGTLVC